VRLIVKQAELRQPVPKNEGRERFNNLAKCLSMFDKTALERSKEQEAIHQACTAVSLKSILGGDYDTLSNEVRSQNNWDGIGQELCVSMPRRFGKTTALAMFIAAYLYTQPGKVLIVFAPSKRQSRAILNKVAEFLDTTLHLAKQDFIAKNQEDLWIRSINGQISKMSAYPARPETGT